MFQSLNEGKSLNLSETLFGWELCLILQIWFHRKGSGTTFASEDVAQQRLWCGDGGRGNE